MLSRVHLAFHARIQDFSSGGGGGGGSGPGQSDILTKSPDKVFWSSAYFTEVKWLISKKTTIFSRFQSGSFSRRWVVFFSFI